MGIVIRAPAPFNMLVFKIPVPITRGGKIFPPYPPRYGYYPRVSVGAGFFDIPTVDYYDYYLLLLFSFNLN